MVRHLFASQSAFWRVFTRFTVGLILCTTALDAYSFEYIQGHKISTMGDGPSALETRLGVYQKAMSFVWSSTFVHEPDSAGLVILVAMRAAARRGVDVRHIIDSYGNKIPKAFLAHLLIEKVKIKIFHPIAQNPYAQALIQPRQVLYRNHDKLLISNVAGFLRMILGDRNLAKIYFDQDNTPALNWEAYYGGKSIFEAVQYYGELWESDHLKTPNVSGVTLSEINAAKEELDRIEKTHASLIHAQETLIKTEAEMQAVESVKFLHKKIGYLEPKNEMTRILLKEISAARQSVIMQVAYFAMTAILRKAFQSAINNGASISGFTNSTATNDSTSLSLSYLEDRAALMSLGAQFFEPTEDTWVHSKIYILDRMKALITSFNMTGRSASVNLESGLLVEDMRFASRFADQILAQQSHFRPISLIENAPSNCIEFLQRKMTHLPGVRRFLW